MAEDKPKRRNLKTCVVGNTDPTLAPIKKIVPKKAKKSGPRPLPTEDQAREIIVALKVGAPYDVACQAASVPKATGMEWLRRGKGEDEKYGTTPELTQFAIDVEESMSYATVRALKVIHNAAKSTWTAAAWYLERTQPDQFAAQSRSQITGKDGKSISEDLGSFLAKGFKRGK
jgi:hypothetical protein